MYDNAAQARASIEREYDINAQGRIVNPGKYEGELLFVPYFYDMLLSGCCPCEPISDDGRIVRIDVTEYDRLAFPELRDAERIDIGDDENGFVFAIVGWTQDERTPLMF